MGAAVTVLAWMRTIAALAATAASAASTDIDAAVLIATGSPAGEAIVTSKPTVPPIARGRPAALNVTVSSRVVPWANALAAPSMTWTPRTVAPFRIVMVICPRAEPSAAPGRIGSNPS
jgi:hypothetical protein